MIAYENNGVSIREARPSDITILKKRMRAEDAAEVWASDNLRPGEALQESFTLSKERYSLVLHGRPIAMFGVVPVEAIKDGGVIWLLGTPDISKIPKTFFGLSRSVITEFLKVHETLYNFVDVRHVRSVAWLKRLGAAFGNPQPYGREQLPFIPFVIRRSHV